MFKKIMLTILLVFSFVSFANADVNETLQQFQSIKTMVKALDGNTSSAKMAKAVSLEGARGIVSEVYFAQIDDMMVGFWVIPLISMVSEEELNDMCPSIKTMTKSLLNFPGVKSSLVMYVYDMSAPLPSVTANSDGQCVVFTYK